MTNALLLADRILVATVFACAGLAKGFDQTGSRKAISDFGLPQPLARLTALILPVAELFTAVLLLSSRSARWGGSLAAVLLLAFSGATILNLLKGRRPDCHCFGQLRSQPISWNLVVRNVAFAAGATAILWQGPGMSIPTLVRRFAGIASAQPLPVAAVSLAVLGFLVETLLLLGLFHQHGRLLLRIDKLEQSAPGSTAAFPTPSAIAGLPIGAPAPSFELSLSDGRMSLEAVLRDGKPVLLVFTDPHCGACAELLPDLERWQAQYAEMITFLIISRVTASDNGHSRRERVFRNVAWQKDREISQSYKINAIPAAVVARTDGTIGTWVATGRPAIQSLVTFLLYTQVFAAAHQVGEPIHSS